MGFWLLGFTHSEFRIPNPAFCFYLTWFCLRYWFLTIKIYFARRKQKIDILQLVMHFLCLILAPFWVFLTSYDIKKLSDGFLCHQRSVNFEMSFCYLQFSKKTNKEIRLYYYGTSSRIVFICFLGELKDTKKTFRN